MEKMLTRTKYEVEPLNNTTRKTIINVRKVLLQKALKNANYHKGYSLNTYPGVVSLKSSSILKKR